MEIKVREMNPSIVKELDEKAQKNGVSRQEYLKGILENYSLLNDINDREMEYRKHLEKTSKVLEYVGKQLEKNTEVLNELMDDDF